MIIVHVQIRAAVIECGGGPSRRTSSVALHARCERRGPGQVRRRYRLAAHAARDPRLTRARRECPASVHYGSAARLTAPAADSPAVYIVRSAVSELYIEL